MSVHTSLNLLLNGAVAVILPVASLPSRYLYSTVMYARCVQHSSLSHVINHAGNGLAATAGPFNFELLLLLEDQQFN